MAMRNKSACFNRWFVGGTLLAINWKLNGHAESLTGLMRAEIDKLLWRTQYPFNTESTDDLYLMCSVNFFRQINMTNSIARWSSFRL